MKDDRPDSRQNRDAVLTPKDSEFLDELLPEWDDAAGPARRRPHAISEAMVLAVVDAAVAAQAEVAAEPTEGPSPAGKADELTRRLGSRFGRRALLVAASITLLSVGAAAAVVVRVVLAPKPPTTPVLTTRGSPARPVVEAPIIEEEPEVLVDLGPEVAQPKTAKVRPPRRKALHPARLVAEASAQVSKVDLSSVPLEDLLAMANTLRRNREWRSADEVYGAVINRFPGSDAAVVAEIASASLHVVQLKDPRGALAGYRRALGAQPTGALAEEARWGVAFALRSLGDPGGELKALREFLDQHPSSALAPAARKRVSELTQ